MPRHFVISLSAGRPSVRAFSTDSVVVLNGQQLSGAPRALQNGDVIAAGSARFTYTDSAPARHAPPPAQDVSAYLVDTRTKTAYRLATRSTGIGRDASNAIVVRDPTASRFHAEIRREAGGFVLHPRGSAGTLVNNRRVGTPCLLDDGDTIEVAYRVLQFTTRPLSPGERVAGTTPTPQDETSRRPTIPRDRTPGTQAAIDAADRRWPVAAIWGVLLLGVVGLLSWLLRR
jgi:hypothetical protein